MKLFDSMKLIALAGLAAYNKAEDDASKAVEKIGKSKLFQKLVNEGEEIEKKTKTFVEGVIKQNSSYNDDVDTNSAHINIESSWTNLIKILYKSEIHDGTIESGNGQKKIIIDLEAFIQGQPKINIFFPSHDGDLISGYATIASDKSIIIAKGEGFTKDMYIFSSSNWNEEIPKFIKWANRTLFLDDQIKTFACEYRESVDQLSLKTTNISPSPELIRTLNIHYYG